MDLEIVDHNYQKMSVQPNLSSKTDTELEKLLSQFRNGCHKIFHKPGYMNAKGDAPYDFTCDSNHRCPKCDSCWHQITNQKNNRAEQKAMTQKIKSAEKNRSSIRQKYFNGQPGCECKPDKMCNPCCEKLQEVVTKYEKGCGAKRIVQFGGMAAGPAQATCQDNFYLCNNCQYMVDQIQKVNKEYPHIKLKHMPKYQRYD